MAASESSKTAAARALASLISAASDRLVSARKTLTMTAVVAGKLLILFLPFLLSLFGRGAMAKMHCLVSSILALLLSVSEYGAVLPCRASILSHEKT